MLPREQLEKIWHLSDTVLYPEAVAFMRRLVEKEDCSPLPTSQVTGLLNIANATRYADLEHFIIHQRDRSWNRSKMHLKTFYTELEKVLTTMKVKRLRSEFHLLRDRATIQETLQEADALMAKLAHDFIQHLVAENGLLAAKERMQPRQQRR